jgi:cell division transport system permease protein
MSKSKPESNFLQPKPNYLSGILSVSLVLFLLGFFSLSILHSRKLVKMFLEDIQIVVECKESLRESEQRDLMRGIEKIPGVLTNSIEYVSKEEGFQRLLTEMGEDVLLPDMENPLFDVVLFNVEEFYLNKDSLAKMIPLIEGLSEKVGDVFFQEYLMTELTKHLSTLHYIILFLTVFLCFIALTIIHNTLKLSLYSNRFLIKNMELAGASFGFIVWPFVRKSLVHGFISGLFSISALLLLILIMIEVFPFFYEIVETRVLVLSFASLLILGLMLNGLSTYFMVRKYLLMKFDDLF